MRRTISAVVFFWATLAHATPRLHGEEVKYQGGGVEMKGYLVYDESAAGKRPGILVVHEWWGHNEYARKRARMLAELGYTAVAVDMYGDGKQAAHPEDASKFSTAVMSNLDQAMARIEAAMGLLRRHPTVDPKRLAAIGYCFGGAIVLHAARYGLDLRAVGSFHGSLATKAPAKPGAIKAEVFVANGADDPFVKREDLERFEAEMKAAGVDYKLVNYPGAKHSFTNPEADTLGKKYGLPLAYDAKADARSWNDWLTFLRGALR